MKRSIEFSEKIERFEVTRRFTVRKKREKFHRRDCNIYIRLQMCIHRRNRDICSRYVNRAAIYCAYYITRDVAAQ